MKAATKILDEDEDNDNISIHAAREGGDWSVPTEAFFYFISIHAAREGGDVIPLISYASSGGFQSTPPVKAATRILCR